MLEPKSPRRNICRDEDCLESPNYTSTRMNSTLSENSFLIYQHLEVLLDQKTVPTLQSVTLENHREVACFRLSSGTGPKSNLEATHVQITAHNHTHLQKVTFTFSDRSIKMLRLAAQKKYEFKVGTI